MKDYVSTRSQVCLALLMCFSETKQSLFQNIADGDCQSMWELIKSRYGPNTSAINQTLLYSQLTTIEKMKNENMILYLTRADKIIVQLSQCGMKIGDELRRSLLLTGLSKVSSWWKEKCDHTVLLDHAGRFDGERFDEHLLDLEKTEKIQRQLGIDTGSGEQHASAHFAGNHKHHFKKRFHNNNNYNHRNNNNGGNNHNNNNNNNNINNNQKRPCIYFLKGSCKNGNNCRFSHQSQPNPPNQQSLKNITCHNCNGIGHYANKCPSSRGINRKPQQQQQLHIVSHPRSIYPTTTANCNSVCHELFLN